MPRAEQDGGRKCVANRRLVDYANTPNNLCRHESAFSTSLQPLTSPKGRFLHSTRPNVCGRRRGAFVLNISGDEIDLVGICKLCGTDTRLVRSHVIPKSLWELDGTKSPPRLITNTSSVYPKRVPMGVYDQTIVCERCERKFSAADDYAADFFVKQANPFKEVRDDNGRLTGYLVHNYDYGLLKLFFIAVLWRAGVSSHPMFARVRLGPFEALARDMLFRGEPGDPGIFATMISVWRDADGPLLMDPFPERLFEVLTYRFYLGRFVAYIKVDRRAFPEPFVKAALCRDGPLHIVSRDLAASKESRVMNRVIDANAQYVKSSSARREAHC
jgi:hypothetical protein